MNISVVNLAACLPWIKLLKHLGIEADGALPTGSRCPACRRLALTIYQDTTCGGQWHVCHSCEFRGDNIELAAAAMGLDNYEAVKELAAAGILTGMPLSDAVIDESLAAYSAKQKAARQMWNDAGTILGQTVHIGLATGSREASPARWDERGGTMIRLVDRKVIEGLLGLSGAIWRPRRPPKNWQAAAIIPFEDLPGRISAFAVGVESNQGLPIWCYRPVHPSKQICPEGITPSGVMHDTAGTLYISQDIMRTILLHVRTMEEGLEPLPLVGIWPESPAPNWPRLNKRPVVVCGFPDRDTFRIASALDAKVSLTIDSHHYGVSRSLAATFVADAARAARPWRDAMKAQAAKLPPAEGASLIADLDPRLAANATTGIKIAVVDGQKILEDQDGWRLASNNELLSDVVMRIDAAMAHGPTGRMWYRGIVRYRNTELPFLESREKIESGAFRFAQQLVVEKQLGVPTVKTRWRTRLLDLCFAFHSPKPMMAREPGWDQESNELVLADYKIDRDGRIAKTNQPAIFDQSAGKIPMPVVLSRQELEQARDWSHGTWRMFITVAYNVMAPIYGAPAKGLLISDGFNNIEPVAKKLGCKMADMPRSDQKARELERPGGWPIAIAGPIRTFSAWNRWLYEPHNFIVGVDPFAAMILAANGNWFLSDDAPHDAEMLDRILADMFHHAIANIGRGLWGLAPLIRLRQAVWNYLEDRGLSKKFFDAFDNLATNIEKSQSVDLFGNVAACLVTRGYIKSPTNRAGIRLDILQINKVLADREMPTFDIPYILSQMGDLVQERNSQVWLVPNEWWETQLAAWKTGKRSTLRLHRSVS